MSFKRQIDNDNIKTRSSKIYSSLLTQHEVAYEE
jgi:hypothetical protein